MIEVYAFLTAFLLQILAASVLYPAWFVRYVRIRTARLPMEELAKIFPGVDVAQTQERFLKRYRMMHAAITAAGLLLVIWLFTYMRRPEWNDSLVAMLITGYFLLQMLPLGIVILFDIRFNKEYKHAMPEQRKRKALLQRRGLFDFVSPVAVLLAGLSYLLFAAFVIYIQQRPFPGFAGLINIGIVTLVYAMNAVVVYSMLYGKRRKAFETQAGRLHAISVTVKSSVYSCIAVVLYLSLNFSLALLDMKSWEPFALSVFFIVCALLTCMSVIAPPPEPDLDDLHANATT